MTPQGLRALSHEHLIGCITTVIQAAPDARSFALLEDTRSAAHCHV